MGGHGPFVNFITNCIIGILLNRGVEKDFSRERSALEYVALFREMMGADLRIIKETTCPERGGLFVRTFTLDR